MTERTVDVVGECLDDTPDQLRKFCGHVEEVDEQCLHCRASVILASSNRMMAQMVADSFLLNMLRQTGIISEEKIAEVLDFATRAQQEERKHAH